MEERWWRGEALARITRLENELQKIERQLGTIQVGLLELGPRIARSIQPDEKGPTDE